MFNEPNAQPLKHEFRQGTEEKFLKITDRGDGTALVRLSCEMPWSAVARLLPWLANIELYPGAGLAGPDTPSDSTEATL